MSLNSYESSRFSGQPVNLYFFKWGDNAKDYYAYTDAEDFVPFGVDDDGDVITFQPIPIDRGKLASSGTLDCQSASKKDPLSACKRDPLRRAA